MVRTGAAGIRGSSSWKLPPIPHTETPQWQKPITNFFKLNSPLKEQENDSEEEHNTNIKDDTEEPDKKKLRIASEEEANDIIEEEKENVVAEKVEEPIACSSSHVDASP
ncbi:uncharacterized protein [Euwallacea fornicatus]|uniref:uncharacterized protein isoform X2 n=1 Tax=Euwallacea fornicatus TaxID=995702 RepID=UPI00338EF3AB